MKLVSNNPPRSLDRAHPRLTGETPAPPSRFCAEAGGAIGAESISASHVERSVLGVPLDSGEIVILVCRRSWWMDALIGAIAGATAALMSLLVGAAMGKPTAVLSAALVGVALGSAIFVMEHVRRMYVLTDRRVIRQDHRVGRSVQIEAPLARIREIHLVRNAIQARFNIGTVLFLTDQGVIVWSGVGHARRVYEIAQDAVTRYGGSLRGM